MRPSAKRIVLELLSAADDHELAAAELVAAGRLLGVTENNIRVSLARLAAAGTLELDGRARYRLGARAQALTREVTGWRDIDRGLRKWDGAWVLVHIGALGRTDRAAMRRRERALRLSGFRMLTRGIAVRPDNLAGGVAAVRDRLYALGLEREAVVVRATELHPVSDARARKLWDRDRLTASYVQTAERIERWLAAQETDLEPRAAAREAFFFGGEVLRKIIYDPRLPEPLVDTAARRTMLDAARRLDGVGRRLWLRLYGVAHGMEARVAA